MKKILAAIIVLSLMLTACSNTSQNTSSINDEETIETITQITTQTVVESSEFEPVATTAQISEETTEALTDESTIEESTEATATETVTESTTVENISTATTLPDIYDYLEYDAIYLQNYLTDCGATNVYFKEMSFEDSTEAVGVMAEFPNWNLLIWFYSDNNSTTNVQQFTLYSADGSEEYLLEANYSAGRLVISGYEYYIAAESLYVLPQLIQDIIEIAPAGEFAFNEDNLAAVRPFTN